MIRVFLDPDTGDAYPWCVDRVFDDGTYSGWCVRFQTETEALDYAALLREGN